MTAVLVRHIEWLLKPVLDDDETILIKR